MRILFVVSVPSQEGSNLSLLNLITTLIDRGHECSLLSCRPGFLVERLRSMGIECKVIRYRASIYPRLHCLKDILYYIPSLALLLENFVNYKKVKRYIAQFAPDIIHTNVSTISIAYKVSKELNIPHVWHIREYLDKDFNIRPFPSMISRKKKLAESYTISITEDIRSHFSLGNNPKGFVIYNGIMNKNEIYYTDDKAPVFLFAAFIQECKGVYDLLEAYVEHLHQRPQSNFILRLLGGYQEADFNRINKIIKDNRITERVEIFGKVSHEVVCNNLRTASVAFIPSFSEGFGRTTAEAMFNGCLVAGRNTGGTKEQFDNGLRLCGQEIGLRFNSVEEITGIMNDICDYGIQRYKGMILSSQNVVKDLYSIESNVQNCLTLYKSIINE